MGKPNRLGRHAKPRQWKKDRRREPDPVITRDGPGPSARAQALAGARPEASAGARLEALPGARPQAEAAIRAQPSTGARPPGQAAIRAQPSAGARPYVQSGARPPAGDPGDGGLSAAARAEQLVSDALQARLDGQHDAFVRCAAELAERPGDPDWQQAVEEELLASLQRAVTSGWRQGWQPAEVVREIGRQFGARHARMATDAANTSDHLNMFEAMRLGVSVSTVLSADHRRWLGKADALRMATAGGAKTTGYADRIGTLAPGKAADLVLIDWHKVAYPYLDAETPLLDAVIQRAKNQSVTMTMCDGEVIYQDGRFTKVDRTAALKALHDDLARALSDDEVERRKLSKALLPHARKFYADYIDTSKHQPFYRPSSIV